MTNPKLTSSSSQNLKTFSLISGIGKRCLFLPLLFNTVLKITAKAIRQEKNIKVTYIRKWEVKLSLFVGDILYKAIKTPPKNFLELMSKLSRAANNKLFKNFKKTIPLTFNVKNNNTWKFLSVLNSKSSHYTQE